MGLRGLLCLRNITHNPFSSSSVFLVLSVVALVAVIPRYLVVQTADAEARHCILLLGTGKHEVMVYGANLKLVT